MSIATIRFSGSTLSNLEQGLAAISHNISNVNSLGFREKLVHFQNIESHNRSGSSVSGSHVASTSHNQNQGSLQASNISSHVSLNGDGFFTVLSPSGEIQFTRAGNFTLDHNSDLVDSNGNYVMSVNGGRINIPPDAVDFAINTAGEINISYGQGEDFVYNDQLQLASFINPHALRSLGSNTFQANNATGDPRFSTASEPGSDTASTQIISGTLERSNVDISGSLVDMIAMQRSYQAVSKATTTADDLLETTLALTR